MHYTTKTKLLLLLRHHDCRRNCDSTIATTTTTTTFALNVNKLFQLTTQRAFLPPLKASVLSPGTCGDVTPL
jgi:hypothetical protein